MAQIDIEEKRGISPIWWILGLIILVAIVWWIVAANNDGEGVVEGAPGTVVPAAVPAAATDADAVTDVMMLVDASAANLVGRQVHLDAVEVQSVVSDRGFWVGPDASQRLFVVRTNQSLPATPPDGAVNQGQRVAVFGTVQRMPANLSQAGTPWNLMSTDSAALAATGVYVSADSVRIH